MNCLEAINPIGVGNVGAGLPRPSPIYRPLRSFAYNFFIHPIYSSYETILPQLYNELCTKVILVAKCP